MIRPIVLCSLIVAGLAATAFAQQSDAALQRAGSWFDNARDTVMKRMPGIQAGDIALWTTAGEKALGAVEPNDLFFTLPKFNPLWDKSGKPVAGASAKYAKRLDQIPAAALERWRIMTGAAPLYAAMSLTAENTLFPQEKFSEKAFETFAAEFK